MHNRIIIFVISLFVFSCGGKYDEPITPKEFCYSMTSGICEAFRGCDIEVREHCEEAVAAEVGCRAWTYDNVCERNEEFDEESAYACLDAIYYVDCWRLENFEDWWPPASCDNICQ